MFQTLVAAALAIQAVDAGQENSSPIEQVQDAASTEVQTPAETPAPLPNAAPDSVPDADEPEDEIIVIASAPEIAPDTFKVINIVTFDAAQKVDHAVIMPVTKEYKRIIPEPIRDGIGNILSNLRQPIVFLNFLLQGKIGKAAETVARFALNSTAGIAGAVDVAKRRPFHLPNRPNGFGNTLGFYGVKPGTYLFLPLVGPTTIRDLIGGIVNQLTLPVAIGKPFNTLEYGAPTQTLSALDSRAKLDEELEDVREADDPYITRRTQYLRTRQQEIDELRFPHKYRNKADEQAVASDNDTPVSTDEGAGTTEGTDSEPSSSDTIPAELNANNTTTPNPVQENLPDDHTPADNDN